MDRQTLAQEITQYLTEQGAARVGFADLHGVTGASLPTAEPILSSRCGSCRVCVDACPSSALYGTLWHTGLDRDDLFDHLLCERTAKERTGRSFGIPIAICGKCFAVCPYTQRYLKSE